MPKYDMTGPHFTLYPTDDAKHFVVWYNMDTGNGYEAMVGSLPACLAYLKNKAVSPLPGDLVYVSEARDATAWIVLTLYDNATVLEVREHGTNYASQHIDRSMIKRWTRRELP